MKRIISTFICIAFLSMLCIPSFAFGSESEDVSHFIISEEHVGEAIIAPEMIEPIIASHDEYYEVYEQVLDDYANLKEAFVDTRECTPIKILADGKILYNVAFSDGTENQLTVERDEQGILTVTYYEGVIHNEIKFLPTGNLLVDGTEVKIEADNNHNEMPLASKSVLVPPLRMSNTEYSLTPWGPDSNYSIYKGIYSGNSCSWGVNTLVGLAVGTVATIICSYVILGIGFALYSNLFSAVASSMITHCNIYGMDDAYFSWRLYKYESVTSMATDHYYKFTGACYSRHDFAGWVFPHTFYQHTYFS